MSSHRRVYIILSAKALPYASQCVATLFENCLEDVDLTLITDGPSDKQEIEQALSTLPSAQGKSWRVADMDECNDRAETVFGDHEHIAAFRKGHPCWRKITDPLLFSAGDEEAIILDPDLYFPNKFKFEETLPNGLMLVYQDPNCLYPHDAVERAFQIPVRLADHVDIGVAQLRAGAVDLDWLDWFVGALGHEDYNQYMHIEAIVWSALAMKMGGGYFDRGAWHCWQRGHVKRAMIAAGVKGDLLLRLEPLSKVKCIHVSGPSKWWVADGIKSGVLKVHGNVYDQPTPIRPFVEYSHARFRFERGVKDLFRKAGYYKLTKSE